MRYWVYHLGKIWGPLLVEEIPQTLPDFGAQSLVCPEKSTGEAEEDWKKAEEVQAVAHLLYAHAGAKTQGGAEAPTHSEAPASEEPALQEASEEDSFFMDQFRTALHELGRKNRDLANAQIKIQDLQQSLQEAQNSITQHRREVAETVYANRQSLLELQIHLKQKEFALEESRQKIGLMESQVQQMIQLQQEVGSLKEKIGDLVQNLSQKEEHLAKTEDKLAKTQENLAKTKVEMEQFKFNLPKITMAPLLPPRSHEAAQAPGVEEILFPPEPKQEAKPVLESQPASQEAPMVIPQFPLEDAEIPRLEIRQLAPALEEPQPASAAQEALQVPAPELWKPMETEAASGPQAEEAPPEIPVEIPTLEIHRLEPAQSESQQSVEAAPPVPQTESQQSAEVGSQQSVEPTHPSGSRVPQELQPTLETAEPLPAPSMEAPGSASESAGTPSPIQAPAPPAEPTVYAPEAYTTAASPTAPEVYAPSSPQSGPEEASEPSSGAELQAIPSPEVPVLKKETEAKAASQNQEEAALPRGNAREAAPVKQKKTVEKPKSTRRTVIVSLMILFFIGITVVGILFFKNALEMVGRPMMDMSTGMQAPPSEAAIPEGEAATEEEIPEDEESLEAPQSPAASQDQKGARPLAPLPEAKTQTQTAPAAGAQPSKAGKTAEPAEQTEEETPKAEKKPGLTPKAEAAKPKESEAAPETQPEAQADFLPGVPIPYSDSLEDEYSP